MYKVFISDYPLIIASEDDAYLAENRVDKVQYSDDMEIGKMVRGMEFRGLKVIGSPQAIWNDFRRNYQEIAAAGGLVLNPQNEVLFIFRNGKWDLPKGKAEKGESIEETAVREVEEECGVSGLEIINALPNTYHTYEMKGEHILKTTFWYLMKTDSSEELKPQEEEGITKVEWKELDDLEVFQNTYPSVKDLLTHLQE